MTAIRPTTTWSSATMGPRISNATGGRIGGPPRSRWRRTSRRGCPSGRCWASWRARPTGSSGGAGSARRRAPTRRSRTRSAGTCWPPSSTASTCPPPTPRHIAGTSARDLALAANRHVTADKLNEAITDVVNAYARLDLIKAWGDGSSVAADGTHMDTYLDNLLAETSIRYGASRGIAYHHISDHYIALFTHFVPCGVWEAVYII